MKILATILLFAMQFTICNAQTGKSGSIQIDLNMVKNELQIDTHVKQYLDLDIFSGVVLIAQKGNILYNKAFGLANKEKNISNTLDTRFDIGSINKTFTKIVIMQLIQEGKIKIDDNLGKYLNGFPDEVANKVTIKDLVDHTSGFGDYMAEPDFFDRPKREQTLSAIIEMVKKMPLHFEPGTNWEYSNAGFALLGGIIEAVTGKSYYENTKDRIVKPLGLKNMVVDDSKEHSPKRAIGYFKTMRGELENNENILLIPTPAGGFLSTSMDLLKVFEAYLYSDWLVSDKYKKYDDFYKFLEKAKMSGGAVPLAGGFEGANAVVYNVVKDSVTIIVLANMDEPVAENLGRDIFLILNGKTPEKPALPVFQNVFKAFSEKGIDYVKHNFEQLTKNSRRGEPKDLILNFIGYDLFMSGNKEEEEKSLELFKLNTELFPGIANVWDSYGEGLLKKGDKAGSLKAYKKALELAPNLQSSIQAVKKLEDR